MEETARKEKLTQLVSQFETAMADGQLNGASEETVRGWLNELLAVFGWDVKNTREIHQERTLGHAERERLKAIGSHNVRPDYTFLSGNVRLAFLDAKALGVDIGSDASAAFQIRSYGWSIGATFSVLTNFKELAIYDCTVKPDITQPASFARLHFLSCKDYTDRFATLNAYLGRESVMRGMKPVSNRNSISLDTAFAKVLCDFRVHLAKAIMHSQQNRYSLEAVGLWAQMLINRILFVRVCEAKGLEEDRLLLRFAQEGF